MNRGIARAKPSTTILLVAALALGGCATLEQVKVKPITMGSEAAPSPLPLRLIHEEQELLRNREIDWGLALSGGGLRSGFYSLGVLKALYDARVLDKVDVISTVSGGGYTGYWLYANHLATWHQGQRFGQYSLGDEAFPQRLCELITRSNFVPYGALRGVLSRRLFPRSVKLYERSLHRTFGGADREQPPLRLPDLTSVIGQLEAPYLVQNATIISDQANRSWPHKLLELTPIFYGSSDTRYVRWQSIEKSAVPPFRKTTAISGAAFPPLIQSLKLPHPHEPGGTIIAHDGGQSENLGAIALIRRGVPNIIVSDAEHDPGYIFEAYRILKAGLELYGLELRIDDIDEYLKTRPAKPFPAAFAVGHVRKKNGSEDPVSTIYYVKATMPEALVGLLEAQRYDTSDGARAQAAYYEDLKATADEAHGEWICGELQTKPFDTVKWAAHNSGSYSQWLKRSAKARFVRLIANTINMPAMRIEFPQYSTADQSFYLDQAQAFVGLGYLQARELSSAITQK
jgi:hypothetical protein